MGLGCVEYPGLRVVAEAAVEFDLPNYVVVVVLERADVRSLRFWRFTFGQRYVTEYVEAAQRLLVGLAGGLQHDACLHTFAVRDRVGVWHRPEQAISHWDRGCT